MKTFNKIKHSQHLGKLLTSKADLHYDSSKLLKHFIVLV